MINESGKEYCCIETIQEKETFSFRRCDFFLEMKCEGVSISVKLSMYES